MSLQEALKDLKEEQLQQLAAETMEELTEKTQEFDMELTKKEAGELFEALRSWRDKSISDDELEQVAGGICMADIFEKLNIRTTEELFI